MNPYETRPFTAATNKLAYAQAFARPNLTHRGGHRGVRLTLNRVLRRSHPA